MAKGEVAEAGDGGGRGGLLLLQFGLQLGVLGRLAVLAEVGHTVLNPEDVDQLLAKGASDGAGHG